ncbi:MAG: hypothetical protein ABIO83_09960 [Ilumatobacteraceae bacterium]
MLFVDRVRLRLRRKWERVDATVVDSRFVARKLRDADGTGGSYEIREYMVDIPGPSGQAPVRLSFEEKSFKVRGMPKRGDIVPVIVDAKRSKTMFDFSDERIDDYGWVDNQERRRKQRDDERFEARRAGSTPAPTVDHDHDDGD